MLHLVGHHEFCEMMDRKHNKKVVKNDLLVPRL